MDPEQNLLPKDRIVILKTVLRGETSTTFEAAIAQGQEDTDEKTKDLTMEMVEEAMIEVTTTISPTEL